MLKTIVLEQALILPVNDITAMLQGQLIVAIPKVQIAKGLSFLLAPDQSSSETETLEKYRSPFLSRAEIMINTYEEGGTRLEAWATCEQVKTIHDVGQIPTLSSLTVWNQSYLEKLLKEQQYLFLTYLKVYRLPSAIMIPGEKLAIGKIGKFVGLLSMECSSVQVTESLPILSDHLFEQRRQKLENLTPPEHPELEVFQSAIAHYAQAHPEAKVFDNEFRVFLGWADSQPLKITDQKPEWIDAITSYGYRTGETVDTKKSNYQAGTDFEIVIRQSLEFLGFKVEEAHQGGAGGIDIFCSQPYSLVGECKSGKSIPDSTVEQLDRIAKRHLKGKYEIAHRFIIGPGQATPNLIESAKISRIAIMKPETLQKLVEFHHSYPISLKELRDNCLVSGQVDDKVDEFLNELTLRLRLRSHTVTTLKKYLEGKDLQEVGFEKFSGVFDASKPPEDLKDQELHDILIELSSPLTGYLGRTKGSTWKGDRFYFLRDLVV